MTTDRSNHTTDKETCQQDKIAREYILNLMRGMPVLDEREIIDRWEIETGEIETYSRGCEGNVDKLASYLERCCKNNPELAELISPPNPDKLAREALLNLRKGILPENRQGGEFGPWEEIIKQYERKLIGRNITPDLIKKIADVIDADTRLTVLLASHTKQGGQEEAIGPLCPPLPDHLQYPPELAASACKWLDDYIAFLRKWSPRGYEDFYEAIAYSLMSTVAARRVSTNFSGPLYTCLFTALVGPSTFFKKSTTAKFMTGLIEACGLDWLFGADVTTPEKLLSNMAGKTLPANYGELSEDDQIRERKRLAFAGQIGWYYDEFGQHLDQMVKENGTMSAFTGLLRLLYDGKKQHRYDTHKRGKEIIHNPYLSLLSSLTTSDIKPYAGKGHKFWSNGLFARFAFVVVPRHEQIRFNRAIKEELIYPSNLIAPIVKWHYWLGEPVIDVIPEKDKNDNITGYTMTPIQGLPERKVVLTAEIEDALYAYEEAIISYCQSSEGKPAQVPESLHSNYGRLPVMALCVAMLLASFDNQGRVDEPAIELRHWARAQKFVEARRKDLHELYAQTNVQEESPSAEIEEEIMRHMTRLIDQGQEWITANKLRDYMKGKSREEIEVKLKALEKLKVVESQKTTQSIKYRLMPDKEEE